MPGINAAWLVWRCGSEGAWWNWGAEKNQERSFGRLEAKEPSSLRKITHGRQADDARRIVSYCTAMLKFPINVEDMVAVGATFPVAVGENFKMLLSLRT